MFPGKHSWTQLPLKRRLILTGFLTALIPFAVVAPFLRPLPPLVQPTGKAGLTPSDLDHLLDAAYRTVEFSQQALSEKAALARRMLNNSRGIKQSRARQVTWPVTSGNPITLPLLSIHRSFLTPTANPRRSFVTEFSAASGAECSIFQKMNDAGDMLLIAASSGPQTIGTVVRASDPEVRAALQNQSYMAPGPSLTAFEPLTRANGILLGMLAISVPENVEQEQIGRTLAQIRLPVNARFFAGKAKLPMTEKLLKSRGRDTVGRVRYFKPWDWIVRIEVPVSALAVPAPKFEPPPDRTVLTLSVGLLFALATSMAAWWWYSEKMTSSLLAASGKLAGNIDCLLRMTASVIATGNRARKAETRTEVLRSVSETKYAAGSVLTGVNETILAARGCDMHAGEAAAELEQLKDTFAELTSSNSQVSGLVKEIAGIALQSRLLALNASIEAARAGHHGASFGVVVEEFSKLAQRCSDNAKSTTALLTNSVAISNAGTENLARVGEEIEQFSRHSQMASRHMAGLLESANRQQVTISGLEASLRRPVESGKNATSEMAREISSHATIVSRDVEAIAMVLNGSKPGRKAKRPGRKSPSFDAKAPAGSRSAHRAC